MRIALLSPFWRPIPGGVARYVEALRDRFVCAGHEVAVFAVQGDVEPGVAIYRNRTPLLWLRIVRQLERKSADVVHVHGHWLLLPPAVLYKIRHPEVRIVFTFHTATRVRGLKRAIFNALLNRCDFVTAVSADLLSRESRRYRLKAATCVTYPGAEIRPRDLTAGAAFRARWNISPRGPVLLAVMPLQYPLKSAGLADLIRAMGAIHRARPDARLVIVGDGTFRQDLERLSSTLGLAEAITFVGTLPDPSQAYEAADLVCHVSYQDELPLAVLEAMAHEKAVVASPVGGIPEVLRDGITGALVSGRPEEIGRSIMSLIEAEDRRDQLSRAARAAIESQLTWEHAAERLYPLYGLRSNKRVHITIDVEEDYRLPSGTFRGVEEALPRILEILRQRGIRASLFVTGTVAERFPNLIRQILADGHHVGTHGYSHSAPSFAGLPLQDQEMYLDKAIAAVGDSLSDPEAFRAPNFRIDRATLHAAARAGVLVDSSVVPGRVVRRMRTIRGLDFRGSPVNPYRLSPAAPWRIGRSALVELPVASNPQAPGSPIGLGFLNQAGADCTIDSVALSPQRTVTFLIHPWEAIDYPPDRSLPTWMLNGCRSDLKPLEEFLDRLKGEHQVIPFEECLEDIADPNPRWWSPGAWSDFAEAPRIVFVTNVFRPVTGGVARYLENLERTLRAFGFEVDVYAYPARLAYREASSKRRWSRKVFHFGFAALCVLRIALLRARGKRVVVHSHGASYCLAAAFFARWFGALALHTFHSPLRYRSRILEWFAPRLDALLYVAPETRAMYEATNQVWHDFVSIVPGGIEVDDVADPSSSMRAVLRRRWGLGPEDFVCLYVGRVVPEKGVDIAIDAVARLAPKRKDLKLLVAGPTQPGPDGQTYVRLLRSTIQEQNASDAIRVLGETTEEQLQELYGLTDCLVVPSRWEEPAPMVTIEAMARGVPVVAAAVGGLPQRVQDGVTGLLFAPEDARQMAERIALLVDQRDVHRRLGENARHWARSQGSIEELGRHHMQIYLSLAREAGFVSRRPRDRAKA